MREPSTAEILPFRVRVQGKDYLWTLETGLDPTVAATVEGFIWKKASGLSYPAAMVGLSIEDLVQEGRLGALRAAHKFDPAFRVKYLTYAALWIHQAMSKALGKGDVSIPVRVRDAMRKAGELPPVASLDGGQTESNGTLGDFLASSEQAGAEAEDQGQKDLVQEALAVLEKGGAQGLVAQGQRCPGFLPAFQGRGLSQHFQGQAEVEAAAGHPGLFGRPEFPLGFAGPVRAGRGRGRPGRG